MRRSLQPANPTVLHTHNLQLGNKRLWRKIKLFEAEPRLIWRLTLAPIWLPHWPAWMCTISLIFAKTASTCLRGCRAASGWRREGWQRRRRRGGSRGPAAPEVEEEEEEAAASAGAGDGGPAGRPAGQKRAGDPSFPPLLSSAASEPPPRPPSFSCSLAKF